MEPTRTKSRRGFAAMSPEKRSEIARMGGRAVPAEKRSFSADRSLAATAGHKGGKSVPDASRTFSRDRALASAAGRVGGSRAKGA